MRFLFPGGLDAVVDNYYSPSAKTDGIRLSVAPVTDLTSPKYTLDIPDAGPYSIEELHATGHEERGIAVISWKKPFVDIYSGPGE